MKDNKKIIIIAFILLVITLIFTSVLYAADAPKKVKLKPFPCTPNEKTACEGEDNNELCVHYFHVWKNQIMKDNMSEAYFNAHFCDFSATLSIGNTFYIHYKFKIDWATIQAYDQFELSRDGIDNNELHESVVPIKPIEKLKYSSQDDALKALQDFAKNNTIHFQSLDIFHRGDGYPYLSGAGTIDSKANKCIFGRVNLFTGEATARPGRCWI